MTFFPLSLSLSFFSFSDLIVFRSEGKERWYTLYHNAVRRPTICRTPPLDKFACAKKIKSVGIRPRCVRVNHTVPRLSSLPCFQQFHCSVLTKFCFETVSGKHALRQSNKQQRHSWVHCCGIVGSEGGSWVHCAVHPSLTKCRSTSRRHEK